MKLPLVHYLLRKLVDESACDGDDDSFVKGTVSPRLVSLHGQVGTVCGGRTVEYRTQCNIASIVLIHELTIRLKFDKPHFFRSERSAVISDYLEDSPPRVVTVEEQQLVRIHRERRLNLLPLHPGKEMHVAAAAAFYFTP